MAYGYYVKAGGAATGNGGRVDLSTSTRTGTWNATASEYYDTIGDALSATTAPTAGDWIIISDASSDTTTGNTREDIPSGVSIVVVDDSNQNQYKPAITPQIDNTSGNGYQSRFVANAEEFSSQSGWYVVTGENFDPVFAGSAVDIRDCTIRQSNTSRSLLLQQPSSAGLAINNVFETHPVATARPRVAGMWRLYGGKFTAGTSSPAVITPTTHAGNRMFVGVDFSDNPVSLALYDATDSAVTKSDSVIFLGCKLHSGWTIINTTTHAKISCIVQSSDSAYQYVEEGTFGDIEFVTDVHYNAHDTLDDGTTKGSYEFTSLSTTSTVNILRLGGASQVQQLSAINTEAATKNKVRVRFVCESGVTLDSGDIWFLVIYPSSGASFRNDVVEHWIPDFQPSAALSTETTSTTWTGIGLHTDAYYFDIDMESPNNGRVSVIPGVTKPNVTVYFSWQLEFVA